MSVRTVKNSSASEAKRRTANPGEVYAYYIESLGKYGACQIIDVNPDGILQATLDYLEQEPPAADQMEALSLYHRQSYRMHHHLVKSWIDNTPVPRDYLSHVRIRKLFLYDILEADMGQITEQFPETEALTLTGSPGKITQMQKIRQLHHLRNLYCTDLFGYSASDLAGLEQLSELRELELESIPKEAGVYLKKCWKGRLDRLKITQLRTEDWLKDNLDNPLRHWDGSAFIPPAAYQSAFRCYKDTKKKKSSWRLPAGTRFISTD